MTDGITRIDIAEFREFGYLQELNRQFLHPLGLALEVTMGDDGTERLGGIWDYRDDPEGIRYDGSGLAEKWARVDAAWRHREPARRAALGYMVQPALPDNTGGTMTDDHMHELPISRVDELVAAERQVALLRGLLREAGDALANVRGRALTSLGREIDALLPRIRAALPDNTEGR